MRQIRWFHSPSVADTASDRKAASLTRSNECFKKWSQLVPPRFLRWISDFEKAVTMAPNYFGTKVLWADYLCTKTQDQAQFKKLLEEVIAADANVDPEVAPENKIEQAKAQKLLKQIDDQF